MKMVRFTFAVAALFLTAAAFSPAQAQSLAGQLKSYYGLNRGGLVVEKTVTCATTATKMFNSDPSRLWDSESLTGSNNCAIGRSGAVTTTTGTLLIAPGGFHHEDWVEDGFIVGYEMWCICSGGSSTMYVTEQKSQ